MAMEISFWAEYRLVGEHLHTGKTAQL